MRCADLCQGGLVIGVNGYDHVQPLQMCANDAQAFAGALKTQFGFTNVTLMTDSPGTPRELLPTRSNIRSAVKALVEGTLASTSEVVLFFSGHGVRAEGDQDWLVPSDGDPDDVAGTCVSYDEFKRSLKTKRPCRALLVVDACRNLLLGKSVTSSGFGKGERSLMGPQFADLQSCQPTEVSLEAQAPLRHSVFTHFLLRALEGDPEARQSGTDVVTFDSLKVYLQGQVSGYVAQTFNKSQLPDGVATLRGMVLHRPPRVDTPPVMPAKVPKLSTEQANKNMSTAWMALTGNPDEDRT